jgi:hypothetical protein
MVQIVAMRVLAAFVLLSGRQYLLEYAQGIFCIDVRDGGGTQLLFGYGFELFHFNVRAGVVSCSAAHAAAHDPAIPEPKWFTNWDKQLGVPAAASRKLLQVCAVHRAS